MRTQIILAPLAASILATGCIDPLGLFGPARFKVTEVEITTSIPDFDDTVVRRVLDYDSQNRLAEVQERTDDSVRSWELGYDGDVVREVRSNFRHAPTSAGWAGRPGSTAVRDKDARLARGAHDPTKPMRQDAAIEISLEFPANVPRQAPCADTSLPHLRSSEKRRQVLPHDPMQHSVLRSPTAIART